MAGQIPRQESAVGPTGLLDNTAPFQYDSWSIVGLVEISMSSYISITASGLSFTTIKISQGLLCREMSYLFIVAAANTHFHTVSTIRLVNTQTAS